MSYEIQFEIPGLPKSTNSLLGAGRFTKHSNAKRWKRHVACAVLTLPKPKAPLTKVKLRLIRFNYRTLDFDGLVACFKPVVDGLVESKILKNDTWKITGPWEVTQEYTPKGQERIMVCVSEVA